MLEFCLSFADRQNPSILELLQSKYIPELLQSKSVDSRVTATFDRPGSGQNSAGTIWMEYSSDVSSLRILAQMVSEL